MIFAQSEASQPLALGLLNLSSAVANAGKPWDLISALTVVLIAPIICVVLAFEPFITRGLAATDKWSTLDAAGPDRVGDNAAGERNRWDSPGH